ncbi:unnamed protein product [Clavelina lepadiformis]|uniref:Protein kinase domain-containing protein n=1 Tax=Clavelina lepadiformis TaxID=159417 RepID=A0ABP0GWT0_CLALP
MMSFSNYPCYNASDFNIDTIDFEGKGNFSVQKGYHDKLGPVVIKVLRRQQTSFESLSKEDIYELETILCEAEKLKKLNHDNIIQFHGVAKEPGFEGIVLELAEGGNLESFLRAKDEVPDIPWWLRKRMLLELFQALRYLHNHSDTKSFVHGNVKSQNILLTKDHVVKLNDCKEIGNTSTFDKEASICEGGWLNVLKTPKHQKFLDIYSASQVAYEIITRCILTPVEFGYLASFGDTATNLTQLEDKLSKNANDFSIFKTMKKVMLKCSGMNRSDKLDADFVVRLLSQRNVRFLKVKKSKNTSELIPSCQAQSFSQIETLDFVSRPKPTENKEATSRRKKHSAYSPKSEIYPEPPIQCSPGCSKSLLETGFEEIFEKNEEATIRRKKQSAYSPNYKIYPGSPKECKPGCSKSLGEIGLEDIFKNTLFIDYMAKDSTFSLDGSLNCSERGGLTLVDKNVSPKVSIDATEETSSCNLRDDDVEVTSTHSCWSPPVAIQFVNETHAKIGRRGGVINVCECEINIPAGALQKTHEFTFMLLHGRAHYKRHNVQILTPTLGCVPAHKFLKLVSIRLPTCYVFDCPLKVTPQKSKDGKVWKDLNEIQHFFPMSIVFQDDFLSWQRVVLKSQNNIGLHKKQLTYICYRNPSRFFNPYITCEIRDNIVNSCDKLRANEGVYGIAIVSSDDLVFALSSKDFSIQPKKRIHSGRDVFEQGFLLQTSFYVPVQNTKYEDKFITCTIESKSKKKCVHGKCFYFPKPLSRGRLAKVTPAYWTLSTGLEGLSQPQNEVEPAENKITLV